MTHRRRVDGLGMTEQIVQSAIVFEPSPVYTGWVNEFKFFRST